MHKLSEMKIYIVEKDTYFASCLKEAFFGVNNVNVICSDIRNFFNIHQSEIDCLVSPANAFGRMNGGYDAALSDILGWTFQEKVQKYIKENFYGEQGVATSFIIDTDFQNLKLIHTPTMRYPDLIKDPFIVYYAMRSTLICALNNHIKTIVIPLFGGYYGGIDPEVGSKMMFNAYDQILNQKGADY